MTGDPILIPCEGSGSRGHRQGALLLCPMCGQLRGTWPPDELPQHDRDDVIARHDDLSETGEWKPHDDWGFR